jgi:hypothetical protein
MYAYLDHSRMGLAGEVYSRDTLLRRARAARLYGLEIPDDSASEDVEPLDVRALVHDVAAQI